MKNMSFEWQLYCKCLDRFIQDKEKECRKMINPHSIRKKRLTTNERNKRSSTIYINAILKAIKKSASFLTL